MPDDRSQYRIFEPPHRQWVEVGECLRLNNKVGADTTAASVPEAIGLNVRRLKYRLPFAVGASMRFHGNVY
jgi:hypothetical protein